MLTGFVIGDRGLSASGDTHPAWMMAHAVAGPYLVVGASAIGQIHLARGLPRDDAFVIRSAGPWLAVAVADGVGSRPLSRYGATYVAEALSALLLRPLVSPLKKERKETSTVPPPDPVGLAPPPRTDQAELRVGVVRVKRDVAALVSGLRDWTQSLIREEPRPPGDLPQAASVGWWPPSGRSRSPVGSWPAQGHLPTEPAPPPPQPAAGVADPGHQQPSSRSRYATDDPNLVDIIRHAFEKTHLGLREHTRSLDLELADLSCTALALLFNVETGKVAVGQVGDGAILGLTAQGKVQELVQAPETGDPQATYTLNRPNFADYLAVGIIDPPAVDPFVALYVMTDGLSGDLLYSPKPEALEDWAQKVDQNLRHSASPAQAAAGMLNWLATYVVKGSWDDRTLVVITRRERNGDRQPAAEQPQPAEPADHR